MIYRVVLDDTIDLHTSDINCMLLNPSLDLEMNSAGSFNFTLPPSHPYWNDIKVLKSTIDVYEDGDLIFTGRIASIEKNWNNERVVQCEGALAYFNDSIHRQMKWETPLPIASEDPTVHNFLKDILDNHNVFEGAENANRHIFIGNITVDPEVVTREVNYDTTLDILTRMCIDTNGGYMSVRKNLDDGKLYLDWIKDFTEESGQPAQFGLNLLNFDTSLAAEDICTGVLARGAEVNEQTVMLNDVELVDETTYPDMSVTHYTDKYQDILWHREGVEKFGQVVQVHDFSDAQTAWKDGQGQIVANSLFEMAKKWLEEKNTKIETIEVEVAELAWLGEGMPKYKLGQIVELSDEVHMAGESYETRLLPMYKLSCDLNSGSKKVTLGTPPKKELTQISASNSDSSTLSSSGSSSGSGGGSGEGEECRVHDVRVDGTSVVTNKIANISLAGKADVSTVNALATTVASKADTSTVNALANVVSGKQNQIEFNTLEAATEVLTRLKADNKVYNLGGGTGGTVMMSDYYSEDEQVVGRWTDGKPLYQKSWDLGSNVEISNSTLTQTTISASDMETIVDAFGIYSTGVTRYNFMANISDGYIKLQTDRNNSIASVRYITLQYTKTTDAPGTGPTKGNLIYLPVLYSEEEREVGVWTDGKPLYQKTTILTGTYTGNMNNVDFGLGNKNIDILAFTQMIGIRSNNTFLPIPFYNPTSPNDGAGYVLNADRSVTLRLGAIEYAKLELTIQYTKTTDQPGSGTWTPEGQLAHHYSTSEKIVGTWIDGSTVYERTWDFGSNVLLQSNTWFNTSIDGSMMVKITKVEAMDTNGTYFPIGANHSNVVGLISFRTGYDTGVRYLTLQYTKTS